RTPALSARQGAELVRYPAVFLPGDPARTGRVAFYGSGLPPELTAGRSLTLVTPQAATGVRRRALPAAELPLAAAVPVLARAARGLNADPAAAFWGAASLFALHLIARGRLLPGVSPEGFDAWRAGPLDRDDTERLRALARAMPPTARALAVPEVTPLTLPDAEPLLRSFLDAVADTMPRTVSAPLAAGGPLFAATAPQRAEALRGWAAEVATGLDSGVRVSLRIELDDEAFRAVTQLHSLADPTLVADAADVWRSSHDERFGARAQVDALLTLRRAARAWPPLTRLLAGAVPDAIELTDDEVYDLIGDATARLSAAGVDVHLPKDLARGLTAQAVVSAPQRPRSDLRSLFRMDALVDFRWQLALGERVLTEQEMELLAEATRPLVRLRDRWVLVDAELVRKARRRELDPLSAIDALGAALTGVAEIDGEPVPVAASGWIAELRARLLEPETDGHRQIGAPAALKATLRGYQLEGLRWLDRMTSLGLGCCLADDMGLGKTITLIALHLHRQRAAETAHPTLVVCPTSLLGNWEREIERFAPGTPVRRYHGPGRHLDAVAAGEFVLTTYGTLRQDAQMLAATDWGLLAADEAQHAKNPHTDTARALRLITPRARVALTGTPVENNLSELWALLDWTTPGLLGTLRGFRNRYARTIEGGQDRDAADRLSRLIGPFVLRRRKSDPGIAPELPPKTQTDHPVALSREQAALYEAFVRETMAAIEGAQGIARRGLVLKLLTALKQICNHPALYLKETGQDPDRKGATGAGRSGKLDLLDELLDTILAEGGSTLVFTQYVEMGRLLQRHLERRGIGCAFLHGQIPVRRRQELVDAFQAGRVPVFLLSLKAAGVGLNLTRAGHVVHYDRWWNPAVEEQATDRAYRIGQTQPVQVHRLITEGTVEDRIAATLAVKRDLADSVLASGEAAFTELSNAQLAELVALRKAER
ncbi:DEAD/DEAH box helicase, partial [Actinocrinis puniceicyclus]